jgi:hypothetical protein
MHSEPIDSVLKIYTGSDIVGLDLAKGSSTMMTLPADYRQSGYAMAREIAAAHGITVSICSCKNKDIEDAVCCDIAGPPVKRITAPSSTKCEKKKNVRAPKKAKLDSDNGHHIQRTGPTSGCHQTTLTPFVTP